VIVSTPQDVALVDARKGVAMFKKISIPVRPHLTPLHEMLIGLDTGTITKHVTLYMYILFRTARAVRQFQEFRENSIRTELTYTWSVPTWLLWRC